MSILLLTQVFPPKTGGSGRWLWELYRRLDNMDVHVIASDAPGSAEFDRRAPIPIFRMGLDFPSWGVAPWAGGTHYYQRLLEIRRIVAGVRPDEVHCGKCLPEGLLATLLKMQTGIPFVVYAHGEELMLAATSGELRVLTRYVLRSAATVIANSAHTQHLLTTTWHVPSAKVVIMHPGVDTSRFVPAPCDQEIRGRLGWANRRVILSVGTLQKRKGQDMMIRALPSIRARCPDALYVMVGEGLERSYLDNLVAEHGVEQAIQFRGVPSDDELIECYQQCDLFALPNRQVGWDIEGFGIVFLEAQACGKTVIAGASGGAPETIKRSFTGEVVACETPDHLAAVTADLLDNPERRMLMGQHGRRRVVEHFDWGILTSQACRLFMERRAPHDRASEAPCH